MPKNLFFRLFIETLNIEESSPTKICKAEIIDIICVEYFYEKSLRKPFNENKKSSIFAYNIYIFLGFHSICFVLIISPNSITIPRTVRAHPFTSSRLSIITNKSSYITVEQDLLAMVYNRLKGFNFSKKNDILTYIWLFGIVRANLFH